MEELINHVENRKDTKAMLYLIRGLPGSGKSTFARERFRGCLHFENDMFHMVNTKGDSYKYMFDFNLRELRSSSCFKFVNHALMLREDIPICVSNVFPTIHSVNRYRDLAISMNHKFKVFRMTCKFESTHNVPRDAYKWMSDHFDDYNGEFLVHDDYSISGPVFYEDMGSM